jgi:DNA-directed RNA polymerase specialized sigma24 family protein
MISAVPQSPLNLTRAREAFLYSIRRRSLRFAALVGLDAGMAQACLQQAMAAFLPESRVLQPARWTGRWWTLLIIQTARYTPQPPIAATSETEPWQPCWNRLTSSQRIAFLLRAWLLLPAVEAAAALQIEVDQSERQLALASLQLRRAMGADPQETRWLDRLRDAFDHLELANTALAPVVQGPQSILHAPAPRRGSPAAVIALGFGCLLIALGVLLSLPREEPLPENLAVPESATGLVRSSKGPSSLPQDVTMLLDQDWPLWSDPEHAAMLHDLEFYAWLESDDAD